MRNAKNAAPHLVRPSQATRHAARDGILTHATLRTLSVHGRGGCTVQQLQATHPGLSTATLAELQRHNWVEREHRGARHEAANTYYSITPTGQATLNAAVRQQLRTQAAAAGSGQHAKPRRHNTLGGPIYAPAPYAIARAEGNDYLQHPSLVGKQLRWLNLASGRWQNKPVTPSEVQP